MNIGRGYAATYPAGAPTLRKTYVPDRAMRVAAARVELEGLKQTVGLRSKVPVIWRD